MSTGSPFPVPWYLVPLNVLCLVALAVLIGTSRRIKQVNAVRRAMGFRGNLPILDKRFCPRLDVSCLPAEVDVVCPPNIIPCGPILQASSKPLDEVDPQLASWLGSRRQTVLVVLGSHIIMDETQWRELYGGIARFLDDRQDLQVLWKAKCEDWGKQDLTDSTKGRYGDRLRIVDWLEPDPVALLRTGRISCSVHHGGSNSYHEALA